MRARILLLAWVFATAACTRGSAPDTVKVFAASSLSDALATLETLYEATHPGIDVQVTSAGSQVLALQIEQGAQAHVFASADLEHFDRLKAEQLVGEPTHFVSNELVLVVSPEDSRIRSFADLRHAQRIVLGTAEVPVGAYAREVLERAAGEYGREFDDAVRNHIVSEEVNARLVRAKVELGEADAALVYRSDTKGNERVVAIEIPPELNVRARYYAGTTLGAADSRLAREFLDYLSSDEARRVFDEHGFQAGAR